MNWLNGQQIAWEDPLAFLTRFADMDCALLYSGRQEQQTGQFSYLFLAPLTVTEPAQWDAIPDSTATASDGCAMPDWVGYLSYECGAEFANSTLTYKPFLSQAFPVARLIRYAHCFRFDHTTMQISYYYRGVQPWATLPEKQEATEEPGPIMHLSSNLPYKRYAAVVAHTLEAIRAGSFYQANITRKIMGSWQKSPNTGTLFKTLAVANPAPYSAYIRQGQTCILSVSPECFLEIDTQGQITTRPIKGSARRGISAEEDQLIQQTLLTSPKNHAENLMIVDLMRNDLAQVALQGSVTVTERAQLYSYPTIHHLISTIRAVKHLGVRATEVVRAAFPPGSMTGAPKRAAVTWCNEQEILPRGVYSGVIGWFGAGDRCALSVVIRTILIHQNTFEFQVGGGIVADSTVEDEWQETLTKAKGMAHVLGITDAELNAC